MPTHLMENADAAFPLLTLLVLMSDVEQQCRTIQGSSRKIKALVLLPLFTARSSPADSQPPCPSLHAFYNVGRVCGLIWWSLDEGCCEDFTGLHCVSTAALPPYFHRDLQ